MPPSLPLERAALTEPCCVAYSATVVNADIRPGDAIVALNGASIATWEDFSEGLADFAPGETVAVGLADVSDEETADADDVADAELTATVDVTQLA